MKPLLRRHGMKMASTTSRFFGLLRCTLPGVAMIAQLSTAKAEEPRRQESEQANPPAPCGTAISILNEGRNYDAFDRQNGSGEKRLRFRLDGKQPCLGECKADGKEESKAEGKAEARPETRAATRIEIVASTTTPEKIIATIDLAGRTASYCVYELRRVDTKPDPHRNGCPRRYLVNFLAIRLVDGDGPFSTRNVDIQYLYGADGSSVSLDRCTSPSILDGIFRRRVWTVPLEDGAVALIGETDLPRNRRPPVPRDPPYAVSVFGAKPE